jgi:uncharacterized protein with HEPN domain
LVRREGQRLDDILHAIEELRAFTAGLDASAFLANRATQQACAAALTVIGEAAKALPSDLRGRHPRVEWAQWAGLRDFLVHQYFRIDQQRIWRIIERDLPPLEAAARAELERAVRERGSDDDA